MVVEAVVGMLACAKLGAVHSVVFGGFAPKELAKRLDDCKPKVVLTASCGIEPNRIIPYLPLVHESFNHSEHGKASRPKIIVYQRAQVPAIVDAAKGELEWQAEVKKVRGEKRKPMKFAEMESDDPLYVLYTS
jgi:propionyl-CoA synthetase